MKRYNLKVIYICGKYRANTEYELVENIRHAEREAQKLWQAGWAVVCPHLNTAYFGGICPDDTWLKGDLEILRRCDSIYLLKGWQNSEGAREEFQRAIEWGKEIIYENL